MEYAAQAETFAIRKCLMNVDNELGNGFLEKVYQEALAIEFKENGIEYEREVQYAYRFFTKVSSWNRNISLTSFASAK